MVIDTLTSSGSLTPSSGRRPSGPPRRSRSPGGAPVGAVGGFAPRRDRDRASFDEDRAHRRDDRAHRRDDRTSRNGNRTSRDGNRTSRNGNRASRNWNRTCRNGNGTSRNTAKEMAREREDWSDFDPTLRP
jgi:transcription termination factor Rho